MHEATKFVHTCPVSGKIGIFVGFILGTIISICMDSIYELDEILSKMRKSEYFVDFLKTGSIEAGIIRLGGDQEDTQTNHPLDELYYIIEGNGYIRISGKDYRVHDGSVVSVPAYTDHNFHGNKRELIVLYVFAKC